MGRKSEAQKYLEQFLLWKQDKIKNKDYVLESRKQSGKVEKYRSSKNELESFEQCYTADETAPYYQARKNLPKYWFISEKGALVTCVYNEPKWVVPSVSGEGNNRREQYEISATKKGKKAKWDGLCLDPGTLVALTFGGRATAKAEALINQYGLLALKQYVDKKTKKKTKGMVELNHEEGYKHGNNTREELAKYRPYNCDLSRIQLETTEQHTFITNLKSIDKMTDNSSVEELEKMSKIKTTVPTIYFSNGDKSGTVAEPESIQITYDEDGKIKLNYDNKSLFIKEIVASMEEYQVQIHLVDENKKDIIRGTDLPEEIYDYLYKVVEEMLNSNIRVPLNTIYNLGNIDGHDIYWMITQ